MRNGIALLSYFDDGYSCNPILGEKSSIELVKDIANSLPHETIQHLTFSDHPEKGKLLSLFPDSRVTEKTSADFLQALFELFESKVDNVILIHSNQAFCNVTLVK